jgi:hypothetical protein
MRKVLKLKKASRTLILVNRGLSHASGLEDGLDDLDFDLGYVAGGLVGEGPVLVAFYLSTPFTGTSLWLYGSTARNSPSRV